MIWIAALVAAIIALYFAYGRGDGGHDPEDTPW